MKIKNVKLEFYILQHEFNGDKMYMHNILAGMEDEIAKKIRKGAKDNWKPVTDRETFKEWLKGEFMYHYWSKSEREFQAGGLFSKEDKMEKIDGWYQIQPNLDLITDYIINKMEIKF